MKIIDLDQLPSDKLDEIEKILSEIDKNEFQMYYSYEGFIRKFLDITKEYDENGNLIFSPDENNTPIEVDGKIKMFDDDIKYNLNTNYKSHINEDTNNLMAVKNSGLLDIFKKAKEDRGINIKKITNKTLSKHYKKLKNKKK